MQKSKTKDLNREHIEKFQKAQRLQQTGHLNEAEKTYQEILTDIPNNPDCIHFLGLLFFPTQNFENSILVGNLMSKDSFHSIILNNLILELEKDNSTPLFDLL